MVYYLCAWQKIKERTNMTFIQNLQQVFNVPNTIEAMYAACATMCNDTNGTKCFAHCAQSVTNFATSDQSQRVTAVAAGATAAYCGVFAITEFKKIFTEPECGGKILAAGNCVALTTTTVASGLFAFALCNTVRPSQL